MQKFCFLMLAFWLLPYAGWANKNSFAVDLQNVNLTDSLRLMAKFLQRNIILSPNIQGLVNLHLHEADGEQAFNMLLTTHGLAKWQIGNVWFVAPRNELIKTKQDEIKWQAVREQAATLQTELWQVHYGKAEELAKIMQDAGKSILSPRGLVRVDARTNIICIQDLPEYLMLARRVLGRLDVPIKQILIKTRIASVDKDYERELGLIFSVKALNAQSSNAGSNKSVVHEMGSYSVAVAKLADGTLLDVKLSALEQAGHAELISTPSLFTSNQQPASIEAGEEVPYQEVSESGGTAVVFKKAVLGLKVTPQVLQGNRVLLQLQINQDRPSNRLVQGVPTISTREIRTNVLVGNGQTVALGGIYEINQEQAENSLPFFSRIPIVGVLFKQQWVHKSKRELLIFVTPTFS